MPRGADDVDDVAEDLVGDQDLTDGGAACRQVGRSRDGPHRRQVARIEPLRMPGEDRDLLVPLGERHIQLEQEPIELRLGQLVGALVLDRVLRGGDDERVGEQPRLAVDADLALLHGLEQCGLSLRWRPVDLVGEEQIGEHGARAELELRGACVVDQRAGDVAGHEVRGELHALEVQLQCRGEGPDEQSLRDAGHALEEHVTAAEKGDHEAADDGVLTDDGLGDLGAQGEQRLSCGLLVDSSVGASAVVLGSVMNS